MQTLSGPRLARLVGLLLLPTLFTAACTTNGDPAPAEDSADSGDSADTAPTDVDSDGYIAIADGGDDCDDTEAAIHPGATEVCNDSDDDCDGLADDADSDVTGQTLWYPDSDGDGYGTAFPGADVHACTAPAGDVADNTDCNDNYATINPGATEVCNGIDDDCSGYPDNGISEEWAGDVSASDVPGFCDGRDADGDGYECPLSILGNLDIENSDLVDLDDLECVTSVGGDLHVNSNSVLTSLFENLDTVGGDLEVNSNAALTSLSDRSGNGYIRTVGGDLEVNSNASLTSLEGLEGIGTVSNLTISSNASLTSLYGLNITTIGGSLSLVGNNALTDVDALRTDLTEVANNVTIQNNIELTDNEAYLLVFGIDYIGGTYTVSGN